MLELVPKVEFCDCLDTVVTADVCDICRWRTTCDTRDLGWFQDEIGIVVVKPNTVLDSSRHPTTINIRKGIVMLLLLCCNVILSRSKCGEGWSGNLHMPIVRSSCINLESAKEWPIQLPVFNVPPAGRCLSSLATPIGQSDGINPHFSNVSIGPRGRTFRLEFSMVDSPPHLANEPVDITLPNTEQHNLRRKERHHFRLDSCVLRLTTAFSLSYP